MISKLIGLLLLGVLSLPAMATDIYRWTDQDGRVNYGDSVPERFKHAARKIDIGDTVVSTEAQRQAAGRAARERAQAVESAGAGSPPSASVGSSSRPGNGASGVAGY